MLVYDVPQLATYDDALKFVNRVAPIKSPNNNLKAVPLGGRRYWHARWIRLIESDSSVEVGTYNRETVVRFYPDNRIEIHFGRWNLGNRQILGALFRNKLKVTYAHNQKFYITDIKSGINYLVTPLDPLVLKFDGEKYLGKVVTERRMFVKRKPMSQVRKEYAHLSAYMHAINKLSGGEVAEEKTRGLVTHQDAEKLFVSLRGKEMEGNEEAFQLLYDYVSGSYSTSSWVRNPARYIYRLLDKSINYAVTDLIRLMYPEEVLEVREVPNSTIVK
jgi:hypothetical protein